MHFLKHLRYGNTVLPANKPYLPLLPATEHHRPLAAAHFTIPQRVEGWVDLCVWLHTEMKCCPRESNPDTVTHPSTNWALHRLTSLVKTNTLPLRRTATYHSRSDSVELRLLQSRNFVHLAHLSLHTQCCGLTTKVGVSYKTRLQSNILFSNYTLYTHNRCEF